MKCKLLAGVVVFLFLIPPSWGKEKSLIDLVKKADLQVWTDTLRVWKTSPDPAHHQVVWLVEAQKDLGYPFELSRHYMARFLDEEDAVLSSVIIEFKPALDFKKGERFRAILKVPEDPETVQKTKKVVIIKK
jgi:hypothetical protein